MTRSFKRTTTSANKMSWAQHVARICKQTFIATIATKRMRAFERSSRIRQADTKSIFRETICEQGYMIRLKIIS
jgi:hypothetical protein